MVINLVKNPLAKTVPRMGTRDGYGRGLVKAGEKYKNVLVLSSD